MKTILGTLLIGLMLAVGGGIVRAGPFEDGVAARERGDYATALQLLRPLAEQGDGNAQFDLGVMYGLGQGVNQDYLRAHMWLNLAASNSSGDDRQRANRSRDRIGKSLTPAQVVRALEMAQQCEARSFKNCD